MPLRIQKKYNLPNYFYMDLWPIADPILYCFDPEMVTQLAVVRKPAGITLPTSKTPVDGLCPSVLGQPAAKACQCTGMTFFMTGTFANGDAVWFADGSFHDSYRRSW